jgi:N-acetylglucosamine-6-sulfatase
MLCVTGGLLNLTLRQILSIITSLALLVVLAVACFRYTSTDDSRPNFILIVTDDQNVLTTAFMPNLQRLLADGGTTFSEAFSPTPLCCPARATLLRGQYAHNHLVKSNDGTTGGFPQFHTTRHEQSTLATWLDEAGYRTALIGKYFNAYPEGLVAPEGFDFPGRRYQPPGWDAWHALIDIPLDARDNPYNMYGYQINHNGRLERYGNDPDDYLTDVLGDLAVDFVSQAARADQPFFLYLAPTAPHLPAIPAPRHKGIFAEIKAPQNPSFNEADVTDKPSWLRVRHPLPAAQGKMLDSLYGRQAETLLAVDEALAALVDTLRARGELDSTYIIFTADHGLHNGEHRLWQSKLTPYRASAQVPLLVRGPGVLRGQEVEALTLLSDVAPTIARLADANPPAFVDGHSLVPWLTGNLNKAAERERVLFEFWPREGFPVDEREEPLHTVIQVPEYRALRSERYLYVEYRYATGDEEIELYDLEQDPFELVNIARHADGQVLETLRKNLKRLETCSGKACGVAEARTVKGG